MDEYEKSEGLPPDTSALVKLYVEESGTQIVREEVEKAEVVATSRIAYVEARAGFSRKLREGELKKERAQASSRRFRKRLGKLFYYGNLGRGGSTERKFN